MSYFKILGDGTINLTLDYGYNTSTISGLAAYTTVDCSQASWIVSNCANTCPDATTSYSDGSGTINKYALIVYSAGLGLTLRGGTVYGEVPQTSDWLYTYNNSAAIRLELAPSATVDDWRIDKVWDGIRILNGSSNFLIDDVLLSNVRDDAVENDFVLSGTIRDTLIDGAMAGLSLGNSAHTDGSMNTIRMEHCFVRLQKYLADGEMTHGSLFKTDTGAPGTTPDLRLINCVFAIEDPTHNGMARLALAWKNVVESRGNVFLNLSDTPLPADYPKPPEGFIILQGQAARDYWAAAEAAWRANHDGVNDTELTALPSLNGIPPAPVDDNIHLIEGTSANNALFGTSGDDQIFGLGGSDWLYGRGGYDELTGGAGRDRFVFDTAPSGPVDRIMDFSAADDFVFLDNAIFARLGTGSINNPRQIKAGWLVEGPGAVARDNNDILLYDTDTGYLWYDADGTGAIAAVKIAHLPAGLDLSAHNFFVI